MALVLERTFSCAQQLLIQAILAGLTRNRTLLVDVLERAVKAEILEIEERTEGDQVKTNIRIPLADQESEAK